ncbi:hypothetical protein HYV82_06215 [Candidatus Woesearchaeota archaeon]|nr:hypothetical protein [Candidatus Woesearchaeota archaeon]
MPKLLRKLHGANEEQIIVHPAGKQAEELVTQYLLAVKEQGKKRISMLDLIRNIHLPVEQIEAVMFKLEEEGKIKEA